MSNFRLRSQRSTDAPMDFEYTNRPNTKPVWAASGSSEEDPTTPKKRSHADLNPPTPLHNPTFGQNQNIPFIFQTPPRQTAPAPYPWAPPPNFSPAKAFPQPASAPESSDIDMREASPPKPEADAAMVSPEGGRKVAKGGMRRVLKSRMKSALSMSTLPERWEDRDPYSDSDDEADSAGQLARATSTSNHYTLNMPSPAAPQSDMPYILLGYLQFFFNLSLILLFLYLVVQFILTVQRDVADRISEYSMDIVQDIAMCALQHRNNLCENPLPAMAHQCAIWATCMARDPTIVGRAKVGAEMIAEVVNGFVEPISWKTLAFTLTSLSFLTLFINALLSLYRSRHQPHAQVPPAVAHGQFPIAPTVHPAHAPPHFGGFLSPAPTPSWGRAGAVRSWVAQEEAETPTRRRRLDGGGAVKIK
ncbi:Di-sulfide bridge nucleocytoplasmic transport domain-containing protein [Mycena maculata]|uniref:Di-sulfide bridge nucleocytoplasmic transport domain-containing protein n=1 Tax=Mycena maculata TaxID=230809 RepID=A0AAD7JWK6_9AGAR|nr:Di-sulfide bridge nucleocytoplasmic transport domain-containing protein [Mycena maculata]